MKPMNKLLLACAAVVSLSMTACQKEGPAERAGKVVDQTVEQVGQQVEKAGENIQDAAKGDSKK